MRRGAAARAAADEDAASLDSLRAAVRKRPQLRTNEDAQSIARVLREVRFFRTLRIVGQELLDMCKLVTYEQLAPGDTVFSQVSGGARCGAPRHMSPQVANPDSTILRS